MTDFEALVSRSWLDHLVAATEASAAFLHEHPDVSEDLDTLRWFADQALLEAVPSNFDTLEKIGFFPFTEASTDCSYSLHLALGGAYKPAYGSLRSYLELGLLGLYFLTLPPEDRSGRRWMSGDAPTPFRAAVVKALQANEDFSIAASHIGFFEQLDGVYGRLCNHTRAPRSAISPCGLRDPPDPAVAESRR